MLGPVNSTNYNNSGYGNRGGYVFMNRIDPTNSLRMFVSFVTGGLWVTSDGGTVWALADTNMPDDVYLDLDVALSNTTTVYAISNTRVIKSTDGGETWAATTLTSATYPGTAYDIAVSPIDPNIVIVRWADKIYRTSDGGTTWSVIVSGLTNDYKINDCSVQSEILDWSTTDNNVVYFLSTTNNNQVKVYRSGDAGISFSQMTTITLDPAANGQIVGWTKLMLPSNNATDIYVAIGTGSNAYGHKAVQLYKLNGITGVEILKRVNMLTGLTDPTGVHHGDICMDRTDETKIVYGTYLPSYAYYSINNGASFSQSVTNQHSDFRSVSIVNGRVMVGTDGESELSTDGGVNFLPLTNSISNHELWGFGAAFKTSILTSGNNHGPSMVREPGYGFEWYNLTGADQGNSDVNPLDDRYIYAQGYSNYRYFRTGLHTFINEANLLDEGGIYSYFNNFEFHPNLYYSIVSHHAGGYPVGNPNLNIWKNSLIRSDDNGASISIVHTFASQLFREKICMTNPNVIYTVVGLTNNQVWKTTDGGSSWSNITPTSGESSGQTNISDIAVHDTDPNQVWITYSGVQTTCKVLNSANGGANWTNLTQAVLTSFPNTKIIFQRGSDGGVYVGNKSGVYYKNNTMSNWVILGNGLPAMEIRNMFINYNLGKLRIGTSRGAWENDLYETSPPKAQISASTNKVICTNTDLVQFKDYSTVRNASTTWGWSFPGGTPNTSTMENPIVSYAGAANGFYNVSLTVTDAYGTSSQTLTNFIEVNGTNCAIDTIPGKLLTLTNPGDFAQQSTPQNITTNTITLSCWIKPNGIQAANAGIIFSASGGATGMNYKGTNILGYHWADAGGTYNYNSGLVIPENVWSHVALVVTPTEARLYLNGNSAIHTFTQSMVNFNQIFKFGIDRNNTSRNFKGLMDEICIYNRALSTNEIRELMNLTRNNPNAGSLPGNDPSLLSYYQINEGPGLPCYDKTGGKHANLAGGATKSAISTAPLGGGTFQRMNITSGGQKVFATPGVELTFPGTGTYPDGDIVVTRLKVTPDQLPNINILPSNPISYFLIRNYGINSNFTSLTSLKFNNVQGTTNPMVTTPSVLKLYKRQSNDDGTTWGTSIDDADIVTNNSGVGTVEFNSGLTITSFSQFSIGTSVSTLPAQLLSFTSRNIDNKEVQLNWKIAKEINLKEYQVERSNDGIHFTTIGLVAARGISDYGFTDAAPLFGNNYYRLNMVDLDGRSKQSDIRNVNIRSDIKLVIGPNPSNTGNIRFVFTGMSSNIGMSMSVNNSSGQLIKTIYFNNIYNNTHMMTDLGSSAQGIYYLKFVLTTGETFTRKFIVSK